MTTEDERGARLAAQLDSFRLETRLPNLVLRPPVSNDGPNMQARTRDMRNTQFLPHLHAKVSQPLSEVHEWIELMRRDFGTRCLFLLVEFDGQVIGESGLGFLDWSHSQAEAGIMLSHQVWRRGLAYEALLASVRFGLEQLGMDRITLGTLEDNVGMRALLRRMGAGEGTPRVRTDGRLERVYEVTSQNLAVV
ncbi:uncharacterized protein PFL1_04716 [Pseudozyma flocculosa PF-1]|uniref:N-acetyltransferase domain-containing protein n=1 Tax=Pseudozyma flocculosa PF-1 TaxID=1277687 RepID=A0A061H4P9_9BASI|nr:uncharacterized protein PFL1_04716 [Pseudozyma flocculosa PF-1]EPQ27578.1 hypothetical protein PFL1_04716 [Pseudozyma flocculosa PF-1]